MDLKTFQASTGCTQADIAGVLGVSRQFVGAILHGRRRLPRKYFPILRARLLATSRSAVERQTARPVEDVK